MIFVALIECWDFRLIVLFIRGVSAFSSKIKA